MTAAAAPAPRFSRILLGLDPTADDRATLEQAAALAERLGASIRGLFVEDAAAADLADNPAVRVVSTVTATAFRMDRVTVERSRRGRLAASRLAVAHVMSARRVTAAFDVRPGSVVDELVAAARDADLVILGWGSRGLGGRRRGHLSRPGGVACAVAEQAEVPVLLLLAESPARGPIVVSYGGTPAAGRALDAALELAGDRYGVVVALRSDRPATAQAWRQKIGDSHPAPLRFLNLPAGDPAVLVAAARQMGASLLVLDTEDGACCGAPVRGVLDAAGCSLLLVR